MSEPACLGYFLITETQYLKLHLKEERLGSQFVEGFSSQLADSKVGGSVTEGHGTRETPCCMSGRKQRTFKRVFGRILTAVHLFPPGFTSQHHTQT